MTFSKHVLRFSAQQNYTPSHAAHVATAEARPDTRIPQEVAQHAGAPSRLQGTHRTRRAKGSLRCLSADRVHPWLKPRGAPWFHARHAWRIAVCLGQTKTK
jgi:hypothetical protein